MRSLVQIMLILGSFQCCTKVSISPIPELENPVSMFAYCQEFPDDWRWRIDYEYYDNNLISEFRYIGDNLYSTTKYEYNESKLLIKKTYERLSSKTETEYIYNDSNQLIYRIRETVTYNPDGEIHSIVVRESPLEYENNLLVREWAYWGGLTTYEYDDDERVVRMNTHTGTGELHHIYYYRYSGDLKTEEEKETVAGKNIYLRFFEYDSMKRLVRIAEDENTIEENFYTDNKLIERKTYYFGIDPGYDPCYGNYIYKFEYDKSD